MEIRVDVDDAFLQDLRNQLGLAKGSDITREALTLLKWAASERKQGREILSGTSDGADLKRLAMPALENLRPA